MIERLRVSQLAVPLPHSLGQLSLPTSRVGKLNTRRLRLRWDAFTCVGWQVTLCDPKRQELYAPLIL